MDQTAIIARLIKNKMLSTFEENDAFIGALHELKAQLDENIFPDVFFAFDDKAVNTEPLNALASLISSVDKQVFIRALVVVTPELRHTAHDWLHSFYLPTLTISERTTFLKQLLSQMSAEERAIIHQFILNVAGEGFGDDEPDDDLREGVAYIFS